MTSPVSVGSVSVEVLADAKRLAKSLKSEVEKAFKDLDFSKAIQDAVGTKPIKVKVEPVVDTTTIGDKVRKTRTPKVPVVLDPDTDSIPEKVKKTRIPKVPVELDPVLAAFQQEIRRQSSALARQAIKIPVEGDTAGLRSEIAGDLAQIQAQTRIKVGTEPGDKAAYETRLKAQLAEVGARVKQNVKVDVDVSGGRGRSGSSGIGGLSTSALSALKAPVSALQEAFRGVSQAMQESSSAAIRFGGSVAGSLGTAAGPVGAIVAGFALVAGGIAGIVGAATVAIPAISALAGALAALPGLLAGAGAGFGALNLGFTGIAEAFEPKASGSSGGASAEDAASRARRIAGAERGITAARRGIASATRGLQAAERGYQDSLRGVSDAQARLAKTQDAINRARREAKEDIEDLGRSLRGAILDEEDATLRVTEALRALNFAKESGILPDISRANLEYRQAQLALENAKDATQDLGEESADASKKGVEGSDKVQNALEDQRDAIQGVKDAQQGVVEAQNAILSANDALAASYDGLKSAQDGLAEANKKTAASGGAGGALKDVIKLAPAAQKFVDAIKSLKPAFEELRLDVQQRLFAGLDQTVLSLAKSYRGPLKETLGSYADTFNAFFKRLGTAIGKPKFIDDLQIGAESVRSAFAEVGASVTTSLVPAFGALSRASAPFIETLGKEIAGIVTEFSNWVLEGGKTGGLTRFFDQASEALHDIFTTGKLVGKIIGNIFQILTNGNGKADKSAIDSFNDGLKAVNDYLGNPANQAKIAGFIDDIKQFFTDVKNAAGSVSDVLDILTGDGKDAEAKANSLGTQIGKALLTGLVSGAIAQSGYWLKFATDQFLNGRFSLIGAIRTVLGVKSPSTVMASIGRDLINGLIGGIGEKLEALKSRATGIKNSITNAFSNAGSLLSNAGRNITASLSNGMTSLQGTLGSRVAGLRGVVTNAFRGAGSLLYNAGRAITGSLQSGISSAAANLGGYLRSLATYIKANKGPIEKDRKLLIPEGQAIMEGLIGGIASKRDALGAQLSDVTGMVAATTFPELGVQADAAMTASLATASAHTFLLDFAPGFTGDFLIDGFKKNIKAKHNGVVQAALGTA